MIFVMIILTRKSIKKKFINNCLLDIFWYSMHNMKGHRLIKQTKKEQGIDMGVLEHSNHQFQLELTLFTIPGICK